MPFTGSHVAAVLPFLRTPLPASALVAGSLAPDVVSYLPVHPGFRTHTALAVVTVDLLLGVGLWALWHGLLAAPLLRAAPAGLRGRLPDVPIGVRRRVRSARDAALLAGAVVLGAATHVLWDEFTHPRRWGTEHLSVLGSTWAGAPGYRWAQDASSVLGLLVVGVWLVLWWRRTTAVPVPARPGWWWPWLVVGAAGVVGGLSAVPGAPGLRSAAVAAAFRGGGVAVTAALVLAAAWWVAYAVRGRSAARR
ncbi:DUF4184 family protein [Modestobacter sp. I12A-02628]|uniref:DUF4184 family protein n=1 Tax=Goekera deserti TaxID=2497753 RepID=A0A7K3W979_9ACTN|nr:DUF4184 family protein [Goekera deserti]MPR00444.1 DUF4184 family protein [Goekera deserti]NDI49159.1 DUF4184 family protein [Goekera deserti]NEL52897.1 DUF4184 family protein [Goekera deserti]